MVAKSCIQFTNEIRGGFRGGGRGCAAAPSPHSESQVQRFSQRSKGPPFKGKLLVELWLNGDGTGVGGIIMREIYTYEKGKGVRGWSASEKRKNLEKVKDWGEVVQN